MKNPKMIFNFSIDNEELESKVNIAVDKYISELSENDITNKVKKRIEKKVDSLLNNTSYYHDKIDGMSLDTYIKSKVDKRIEEVIDQEINNILGQKITELLKK